MKLPIVGCISLLLWAQPLLSRPMDVCFWGYNGPAVQAGTLPFLTPSGPAPTIPMRLFSAPLLGQALGARLLLVG